MDRKLLASQKKMDRKLYLACLRGDMETFQDLLVEEGNKIVDQVTPDSETCLHLAARLDHLDLAKKILSLQPKIVYEEDENGDTPLHQACRENNAEIVALILQTEPWAGLKVNKKKQSPLFVACERGHFSIVMLLLDNPRLLAAEEATPTHPLLAAASAGHAGIVRELLKAQPNCTSRYSEDGRSALHFASGNGRLDVTRELIKSEPNLCLLRDNEGRTPLHYATNGGHTHILDEILLVNLNSAWIATNQGETILHFAVRNGRYKVVKYLVDKLDNNIVNIANNDGNTILHLATESKLSEMVEYLIDNTSIEVNVTNRGGLTALDVANLDRTGSSKSKRLQTILRRAGKKRNPELPPLSPPAQLTDPPNSQLPEPPPRQALRTISGPRRQQSYREYLLDMHLEELQGVRNTITVIAVLIAAAAFASGITPPGGVYQDGLHAGKSVLAHTTSFKVFIICNYVALFLSLGIVIVLVSIITFKRRSLMVLLAVTHKVLWVAVASMTVAYVASTWAIMPRGKGIDWLLGTLVAIAVVSMLPVFAGLTALVVRHRVRKNKLRKEKEKRKKEKEKKWRSGTFPLGGSLSGSGSGFGFGFDSGSALDEAASDLDAEDKEKRKIQSKVNPKKKNKGNPNISSGRSRVPRKRERQNSRDMLDKFFSSASDVERETKQKEEDRRVHSEHQLEKLDKGFSSSPGAHSESYLERAKKASSSSPRAHSESYLKRAKRKRANKGKNIKRRGSYSDPTYVSDVESNLSEGYHLV